MKNPFVENNTARISKMKKKINFFEFFGVTPKKNFDPKKVKAVMTKETVLAKIALEFKTRKQNRSFEDTKNYLPIGRSSVDLPAQKKL
mmetsp:Transcript_1749/g.2388  ORF Transcript_1749/g.2388 Transcript_1749/m.2388 type:complete len:88 (-) Transcript_1749:750-1013(-)